MQAICANWRRGPYSGHRYAPGDAFGDRMPARDSIRKPDLAGNAVPLPDPD